MDRTRTTIAAAVALTAMALAGQGIRAAQPRSDANFGLSSIVVAGRDYVDVDVDADFLDVLRAREVLFRTYDPAADEPVWVFLGYFDRQKEGSQVHSPRHCYPGSGWNIEREVRVPAPWRNATLPALVVNNGREKRIVCFWYQTPHAVLDDVFRLKLALTREAVLRRSQDVVFASVSTPLVGPFESAAARATDVARDVEMQIARVYATRADNRAREGT